MFDILNLMLIGAHIAGSPFAVYPDEAFLYPRKSEVTSVSFHQGNRPDATTCHFHGFMTAFARDWTETVDDGFTVTTLQPEPDKKIGFAYIIYKKSCPNKADEMLLNTAEFSVPFMVQEQNGVTMFKGNSLYTTSIAGKKESDRPKWLPQVLKLIEKAAATNPAAKEFVELAKQTAVRTASAGEPPPSGQ